MTANMSLSKEKLEYFKKELEKERNALEKDLEKVGRRNPRVPGDWEVDYPDDMNIETSDKNDLADTFEEMENRFAIEDKLEERLIMVNKALNRIKKGNYGICKVCGKNIEEKRLKINPVAETCIRHAK